VVGGRIASIIALGVATLAGCGGQEPAAHPGIGLVTGTVRAGPVTPLARPGVPATRPLPGATIEALRAGEVAATALTDAAGRYQLRLPPGSYQINAKADTYLSKQPGKNVTVSVDKTLTVSFVLDTGIR
jgi:Carboxypeptidase regulatory-like domain